jgi:surface protein
MFAVCQNLTSLDLSHFNTEKVTDMNNMFFMCQNLTSLDLSHFNTEKVTNMNNMFAVCNRLTSLDLSHFDMSRGVNKDGMCYGLSTISKHCTITCTAAVQTALQNGTDLPTPEEGVTFTWVRPTSK